MEIKVVKQILAWNEDVSESIRRLTESRHVAIINIMGSPGAGKTSLIKAVISGLREEYRIGVIEGDIAGQIDAEAIDSLGIPVVQLQTDGACHIEAMSIEKILPSFDLDALDVLLVENIGNLVCPAEFNIGEDFRVSILSIPEGDDKVAKYPLMFATTDALALNKYDMLPYFDFDPVRVENDARDINPRVEIFPVSSKDNSGIPELLCWLRKNIDKKIKTKREGPV